jgi:hypothetical protein
MKRRWVLLPWQWRSSGLSRVFAVTIDGGDGQVWEAFVKVGGGYGGLLADDLQVR